MQDCGQYEEALSALTDGELSPQEESALRAHMDTCKHCKELYHELEALRKAFAQTAEAPETLLPGILYKRSLEIAPVSRWRRVAASLAGIAACLLIALFLSQNGGFGDEQALRFNTEEGADLTAGSGANEPEGSLYADNAGLPTPEPTVALGAVPENDSGSQIFNAPKTDTPDGEIADKAESTSDLLSEPKESAEDAVNLTFYESLPDAYAKQGAAFYATLTVNEAYYKTLLTLFSVDETATLEKAGYLMLSEARLEELSGRLTAVYRNSLLPIDEESELGIVVVELER